MIRGFIIDLCTKGKTMTTNLSNNSFKQKIDAIIGAKHLLKHPFYIAWTEGKLTKDQLKHYA
jgi:pyrroloquinoline-quinone synthase